MHTSQCNQIPDFGVKFRGSSYMWGRLIGEYIRYFWGPRQHVKLRKSRFDDSCHPLSQWFPIRRLIRPLLAIKAVIRYVQSDLSITTYISGKMVSKQQIHIGTRGLLRQPDWTLKPTLQTTSLKTQWLPDGPLVIVKGGIYTQVSQCMTNHVHWKSKMLISALQNTWYISLRLQFNLTKHLYNLYHAVRLMAHNSFAKSATLSNLHAILPHGKFSLYLTPGPHH